MAAANASVLTLSAEERAALEAWLREFDQSWGEKQLAWRVRSLPALPKSLRFPALVEMVKIDLKHRWRRGKQVRVESYLKKLPQLGGADGPPADLIQAEYEARWEAGVAADPDDFARRFPARSEELRRLLDPGSSPGPLTTSDAAEATVRPSATALVGAADAPALPEQFGRYRIVKRLGRGGMGTVYLAHDAQFDRPVALKVPHFAAEDGPDVVKRFLREARSAAALHHPNFCPVHDIGAIDGVHYLAMAYVEGESLAELIRRGEPRPLTWCAALVRTLALALQEAHQRGVVHRDLKPSNIMIDRRGEPVILDFGLARRAGQGDTQVTRRGGVVGTPGYLAPEQLRPDEQGVSPLSDVYSLGVVLYELLTGQAPFHGRLEIVLAQVLMREPEPPSALRPEIDADLQAICLKAMAKKTTDRYASMADLAAALADYLHAGRPPSAAQTATIPLHPPTPARPRQPRRPLASMLRQAALGLAAVSVLGALLLAIVYFLPVERGSVRIRLDDPAAIVRVDGQTIAPDKLAAPLTLTLGKHRLEVLRDGVVVKTLDFTVGKEPDQVVRVEVGPSGVVEGAFRPLFNGKDLDGWEGLSKYWSVKDKAITGSSFPDGVKGGNTYLHSKKKYRDFELKLQVRLKGEKAISGVLFRGKVTNDASSAVSGPQCDLGGSYWGNLYGERTGQGTLAEASADAVNRVVKKDDFNDLTIRCAGRRVVIALNEETLVDDAFTLPDEGVIALQLHEGAPMVATFRNIEIKELILLAPDGKAAEGAPPAVLALIASLTDEDAKVRTATAASLGKQKYKAVVGALANALRDDDASVRRAAAHSLRDLADPSAADALVNRVADDVWGQTLGSGVLYSFDESLYEDVATGKSQGAKYAALEALKALAPERVTEALTKAQKSKNANVRGWAVKALAAEADKK